MEVIISHTLLILLFLWSVETKYDYRKAEEKCDNMTRRPFYNTYFILGKWRIYYTLGIKLKNCTYINIKPVSDTTKERFAEDVKKFIVEEPNWYEAELLVVMQTGPVELLMFPQGDVRGRYRALVNPRRFSYTPNYPLTMMKYAMKAYLFFRYLILANCEMFSAYVMARPNDTMASVKEIMSFVDEVFPGEKGAFACLP